MLMPDRPPSAETCDFLGLPVWGVNRAVFADWLVAAATDRSRPRLVGYVNAAMVNLAADSSEFRSQLGGFDRLIADGQSIVWASRWLGNAIPERLNITDIVHDVLAEVALAGLRVAVIGGRPGEAAAFATVAAQRSPGLEVVMASSGYLGDADERAVREELEATNPDLVLMGMGAPLQERRTLEWAIVGEPRAWWCVGAAFEYFAGTRRRAPVWLRRAGLEWVFRLALEPRRLARRYLIGNPVFVWRVARGKPLQVEGSTIRSDQVRSHTTQRLK